MNKKAHGFTIVELLIVIVVIAILAAISIAAYTNIQQRAKNTAIINAASQSLKMIEAYIAANGDYPMKSSTGTVSACITTAADSGCQASYTSDSTISSNSTFDTNMATVGILPKNVPAEGSRLYGLTYQYNQAFRVNDESQPVHLVYYLFGTNQNCGVNRVMRWISADTYQTLSNGYTDGNNGGLNKTLCWVSVPGPAHS